MDLNTFGLRHQKISTMLSDDKVTSSLLYFGRRAQGDASPERFEGEGKRQAALKRGTEKQIYMDARYADYLSEDDLYEAKGIHARYSEKRKANAKSSRTFF